MAANRPIVIAGAAGQGRESLAWVSDAHPDRDVLGFLDDAATDEVAGLPVVGPLAWLSDQDVDVVVGFSHHHARQTLRDLVDESAGAELLTVIHPGAYVGPGVTFGPGCVVAPNVTITRDSTIGPLGIVNFGAQIGHDTLIEQTVFIGPGACLGGNVTVREDAWIGIGATVLQELTVGYGAIVGGGATVTRDVADGDTVVGTPAKQLWPPSE